MGPYDLGAAVPPAAVALSITDATGAAVAAATPPVLTITLPDGTATSPAVTSPATGTYQPSTGYVTVQEGDHRWSWAFADSGAYLAATEMAGSFEVRTVPDPSIISLDAARDIVKLTGDDSFDSDLRTFSRAVTGWVEYVCGPVVTRQVSEVVRAQGRVLILSKPPVRTDLGATLPAANRRDGSTTNGLVSITPLLSYGFMYALDELLVDGPRGIVRHIAGLPFFYSGDPYSQFAAVYWAGREVIPAGIYEGTAIALKHVWAVERGGVTGQRPTFGEEETTPTGFGFAVPNRAVELLTPHSGKASRAAFA